MLNERFPFYFLFTGASGQQNSAARRESIAENPETYATTDDVDEDIDLEDDEDKESDDDSEEGEQDLHQKMSSMSVAEVKLTLKLPLLVYSWIDAERQTHCSVDILLLSGSTIDQILPKINKKGTSCTIQYKYPLTFLGNRRLLSLDSIDESHAKTIALDKAISDLQESQNMEEVKADFTIKLPFKCEEKFQKPAVIGMYAHDNKTHRTNFQMYCMLHLEFLAASKPRNPKPVVYVRMVTAPDEYEEEELEKESALFNNFYNEADDERKQEANKDRKHEGDDERKEE